MRYAIFGSGGVGGYFGGRLAQAGEDVTFIARGKHLQAIKSDGLRVTSIEGDFTIFPAQATENPEEVGMVDFVLLGIKSWQVPQSAHLLRPLLGPHTGILTLQNGVSVTGELIHTLGESHVLGGLCHISSFLGGPGSIEHVDVHPRIFIGELNQAITPRIEQLHASLLRCTGLKVEISKDIVAAMWNKFIFVSAFSGISTLTRLPAGGFRHQPETRALFTKAVQETTTIGRALGVSLPTDQVEQTLAFIDFVPPGLIPSMQKDILEGRPSELEAQNGAVIRMAHALGIPVPIHEFIYACLLPGELKVRSEIS